MIFYIVTYWWLNGHSRHLMKNQVSVVEILSRRAHERTIFRNQSKEKQDTNGGL